MAFLRALNSAAASLGMSMAQGRMKKSAAHEKAYELSGRKRKKEISGKLEEERRAKEEQPKEGPGEAKDRHRSVDLFLGTAGESGREWEKAIKKAVATLFNGRRREEAEPNYGI